MSKSVTVIRLHDFLLRRHIRVAFALYVHVRAFHVYRIRIVLSFHFLILVTAKASKNIIINVLHLSLLVAIVYQTKERKVEWKKEKIAYT